MLLAGGALWRATSKTTNQFGANSPVSQPSLPNVIGEQVRAFCWCRISKQARWSEIDDIEKLAGARPYYGVIGIILQKNPRLSTTSKDAPNVFAAKDSNTTKSLVPEVLDNIFLVPGLPIGASQSKGSSVAGNKVAFTSKFLKCLCFRQRP